MKKKILVILFFVFIFFTFNGIVYFITELDKKDRIKKALDSHISRLKTHYEIIIHDQELNADSVYKTTIDKKPVIDILTKALKATKEQKAVLREQLHNYLLHKYEIMKDRGVLQYHFISPENICFLRMHKFNKFDDNLSDTRADIKYVNLHKTIIRGFEQGRTAHGFRNVYPVYGKNNIYLGVMEISFGSEILQERLTHISKIHSHFLVDKNIFDAKAWQRDDLVLKYVQSVENKNLMITMTQDHTKELCVVRNNKRLKKHKDIIDQKMKQDKSFAIYVLYDDVLTVASFLPIKNIRDKSVVAWLVSYEKDEFIKETLESIFQIRIFVFFITLLLSYFIYRVVNQKDILDKEVRIKTSELNKLNSTLEQKIKIEVKKNKDIQNKLYKSEKLASMGEMIGNIAHQWRQPLSVISTAASGMKIQKEYGILKDDEFFHSCDAINNNAQYLSKTIDDFKNFIKGDTKTEQFFIADNINSFLHIINGSVKTNNINMLVNVDNTLKISGYPNELIQCYINIFNNSKDILIENNEEDFRIFSIDTYKINNNIIIEFKDNAGGISESIIDKIFEPYFTTKHKSQGTGLGLNMVYNMIVNGMNGSIEVNNTKFKYNNINFKGAKFTITLPLS